MKNRYTLTLDPEISHQAKNLAKKRGTSLSSMVEKLLLNEIGTQKKESGKDVSFSQRWAGKIELAEKNEPRYHTLKSKYQL
jgi:hypothetical protein